MSKKINLEYNDKKYVLEFTRESISVLEQDGFKIAEIGDKPITMIPKLVKGAFLCNHPEVNQELIDEIYSNIQDKGKFLEKLAELYAEPIEALTSSSNEGNATWGVNW